MRALLTAGASIAEPLIIAHGQNCELPVHGRSTALHLAAEAGHVAIVVLLLHAHVSDRGRACLQASSSSIASNSLDLWPLPCLLPPGAAG